MRSPICVFSLASIAFFGGCVSVKTEPLEVKPIHITVDVNVNVKVEKALNDFFGDIDRKVAVADAPPGKS